MKPNTLHGSHEVIADGWRFLSGSNGSYNADQIAAAALLEIHTQLVRLNRQFAGLGEDGIHGLIRLGAEEMRRRDRKRRALIAAKARRTRARNKKKGPPP